MNASRFRLVFSRVLGMLVPVSEGARTRSRSRRSRKRPVIALGTLFVTLPAMLHAQTPPIDGTVPIAASQWVSSGQAGLDYAANVMTITQGSQRVILNWDSFNIAAGHVVNFVQPDASAAALNRIGQGVPSVIAGQLNANGQVYLLNPNGVIFDRGAQINVGGLIASALNIPDATFNRGLLSVPVGEAAFSWGGTLEEFNVTQIVIKPDAKLATNVAGGSIMLFAPKIVNEGTISTPDGQTMLAAGSKVFLTAPLDATLRGFLVEVDPFLQRDSSGNAIVSEGGMVTNEALGRIIAERGNVTLASFAVNQNGRVSATTSVRLNGSVFLQARDTVSLQTGIATVVENNVNIPRGLRTGRVTLGEGSVTEVMPEVRDGQTIQDAQSFTPSSVGIVGNTVHLKRNSLVAAPGGNITVSALAGQVFQTPGAPVVDGVRVYVEQGSRIDVSGTVGSVVSVERNFIEAELRGNELRDAPLLRDSFLRGSKVTVDIRKGTPLADISGYVSQIARTVEERTAVGGNITIRSEGDVVLREGSLIDVSGGQVRYTAGTGIETTLVGADGRVYRMSEATPNRTYLEFADRYTVSDPRGEVQTWRPRQSGEYQPGYFEGKNAGSISFNAHAIVLEGDLRGSVVAGPNQREAGQIPVGGELVLGDASQATVAQADFKLAGMAFTRQLDRLASGFDAESALPAQWRERTQVDVSTFSSGGFTRLRGYAKGAIDVPAGVDLNLAPGGSIVLTGRQINVDGRIVVPSGSIALTTRDVAGAGFDPADYTLTLGSSATVSAAGLWVNDSVGGREILGTDPIRIGGGSVTLSSASDLKLAPSSVVDVSGGAYVKRDGTVVAGNAGSLSLSSGRIGLSDTDRQTSIIELGGSLRGYAIGTGGALNISTSSLVLGGAGSGTVGELVLGPEFFRSGGFRDYSFSGRDSLTVADGVEILPRAESWKLTRDDLSRPTGSALSLFADPFDRPDHLRVPASMTLSSPSAVFGKVFIGEGARVAVDPGGAISVSSGRQVTILGVLEAPAGTITIGNARPGATESFEPDVTVWLGSSSRLLASGFVRLVPDAQGLRRGEVLDGGSVTVSALKGYLVAEAGSVIDVSGVRGELDIAQDAGRRSVFSRTTIAGAAGSVSLEAREGLLFDGTLRAAPGGAGAAGGTLSVTMDELPILFFPSNPRQIVLTESTGFVPAGLRPGNSVELDPFDPAAAINGKGFVSAGAIRGTGFDSVSFKAGDAIRVEGPIDLSMRRSIVLDAPTLVGTGADVSRLTAAHVAIGNADLTRQSTVVPVTGPGSLVVQARLIDVIGASSISGFNTVRLSSTGDIRLRGVVVDTDPRLSTTTYGLVGSLAVAADLTFEAAQVYPTTLSDFSVSVTGMETGRVTFQSSANAVAGPVLSAAGRLRVAADEIAQNGVVKAPFGTIELDATNRVSLGAGSVTSVSGDGKLIPFGRTELSGIDYVYALGPGFGNLIQRTTPEKQVLLEAPAIDIQGTVDLSGGGDLFAYEFTPGPGGSRDVLEPANAAGAFAILPSVGSGFGPVDHQYSIGVSGLGVGDQVHLSGVAGLPDGVYTLLPARYALLPGGFLVTPATGALDIQPSGASVLSDRSQLVSGYRMSTLYDGSISREARTSGFYVASGAVVRTRAEYQTTLAGTFFAGSSTAQLPGDAGRLALSAAQALVLDGRVLGAGTAGRRGAEVDIAAPKLAVVAPGAAAPAGYLVLETGQVNGLGASSLLLGGLRTRTGDGFRIDAGNGLADSAVLIATDASNPLKAGDVMLAATGEVVVGDGAVVIGTGGGVARPGNITIAGNGAFVRVSTTELASVGRSDFDRSAGTLRLGSEVRLEGAGSVILDATRDTLIAESATIVAGAVSVAAGRVSLGDVPDGTPGLVLTQTLLGQLGGQGILGVKSYSSIDFHGAVTLGAVDSITGVPAVRDLRLDSAHFGGYGSGDKVVRAHSITVINTSGDVAPSFTVPPSGTGALTLHAIGSGANGGELVLGAGDRSFQGFGGVDARASGEIRFTDAGSLSADTPVTLDAGRIVADGGADQRVASGGMLTISASVLEPATTVEGLGGRLRLSGTRVLHEGRIVMPAGSVVLEATGATAGDGVTLARDSRIDVAGRTVEFAAGVSRAVSGGSARLTAAQGDVVVSEGAWISVAAGGDKADGGLLELVATQGRLTLDGQVIGTGGAQGGREARAVVDVAVLDDFSPTERAFAAGGFGETRRYRIRTGDLIIGADDRIRAKSIGIAVDAGALTLGGSLDASGQDGGRVELWARDVLTLGAKGVIDASATSATGKGGRISLGTSDGSLDLADGSRLSVAGSGRQGGREIVLRAPRIGNEFAVAHLGSDISSGALVIGEAVRVYELSSLGATEFSTISGDSAAYMSNAGTIRSRLSGLTSLRAGVEVRSDGDLTLAADWNLFPERSGGEPGVLTLRAGRDLILNGSLSDGFTSSTPPTGNNPTTQQLNPVFVVQPGDSWSYRLVGGADLGAADPLAVVESDLAGDVTLATNRFVRTGSGSIDVSAGRDVVMTSVRSTIYTAGVPGPVVPDFTASNITGAPTPSYTERGGDIRVSAGRDVRAAPSNQLVSEWLYRDVKRANNALRPNPQTTWWVRFDAFQQGVGALGGGDIEISAGRDVNQVSAAIPTNGRLYGDLMTAPDANSFSEQGGGNLTVRAGRDVLGGVFHVQKGRGLIEARGDIGLGARDAGPALNPVVALGDAQVMIRAAGNATIETAFNPTVLRQARPNTGTTGLLTSYFFTYGETAALDLQSATGTVRLSNNRDLLPQLPGSPLASRTDEAATALVYPGIARLAAFTGDVVIERPFTMYPSARGQLELLAANDVAVQGTMNMSDVSPTSLPTVMAPDVRFADRISPLLINAAEQGPLFHAETVLHRDYVEPIYIIGKAGDVSGPVDPDTGISTFGTFAKPMQIIAGRDVRDLWVYGQNVRANDVTLIQAGRDFRYSTLRTSLGEQRTNNGRFELGGPGELQINAGRDVDLGNSGGIVTRGNFNNPFLAEAGAAIRVGTGAVGGNNAGFVAAYLEGGRTGAQQYLAELAVHDLFRTRNRSFTAGDALALYGPWLTQQQRASLESNPSRALSEREALPLHARLPDGERAAVEADALVRFKQLESVQQTEFLNLILYSELKQTGRDYTAARANDYLRGYRAILTLFPLNDGNAPLDPAALTTDDLDRMRELATARYAGDLSLFFSQIKTEQGGDLDLRIPGGLVNAGLANPGSLPKSASELGIVTVRGGSIRSMVAENFLVNQSRVFTLQGGDIMLWSSFGDIDAGRGEKTATATPPPQVVFRGDRFILDTSRSVEGSGIGVLLGRDDIIPGDVDLIAPRGEVNAGDAGIRVAGNLNIAALQVVNAQNISVGGASTGVPAASSGSIAGLGGISSVANEATRSVQESTNQVARKAVTGSAEPTPSFLTVEVVGLGEDDDERKRKQ